MGSINSIFSIWPDLGEMASALGQKPDTVYRWKRSGRIPETAWMQVISAAAHRERLLTIKDLYEANRPARQRGKPAHKNGTTA
jgi:hypothetical protein